MSGASSRTEIVHS